MRTTVPTEMKDATLVRRVLNDSEARFKVLTTSFREGLGEIVWPTLSEEERGPAVYRRDEALKRAVLGQAVTLYEKLTPSPTMTTKDVEARLVGAHQRTRRTPD